MKSIMFIGIVIAVFGIGFQGAANGQAKYPTKPVQLIVAYGPTGAQDMFWRLIKDELEKHIKQPISIVNKPGAGGALAADFVANAKSDGYTLVGVSTSVKTIIPAVDPKAQYNIHPIALVFRTPLGMVVRSESNLKSLKDVINAAKEKPGDLTCATQGIQVEAYFDYQMICSTFGVKITHVPNPNASDAVANVMGGHVDFWLGSIPGLLPLAKGGRLRILAFTGDHRLPDYPDMPTFAEQGLPQANMDLYAGIWGPKDMPQEVYSVWQNAMRAALANPEIQAACRKNNMYIDLETDRDKISKHIKEQFEKALQIAKKEGIQVK